MPDNAVRATTDSVVRQCGTPSAREASRNSGGTSSTISSVVRVTSGIIIAASATEPASVENPPNGRTITAYAKIPTTIDGIPIRTSAENRTQLVNWLPRLAAREKPAPTPIGTPLTHG